MNSFNGRLERLEEGDSPGREIEIKIELYRSSRNRDEDGGQEIKVEIPDELYEIGPWQELGNGDRLRVMRPREIPPETDHGVIDPGD